MTDCELQEIVSQICQQLHITGDKVQTAFPLEQAESVLHVMSELHNLAHD
jgi:hypothetical protein